MTLHLTTNRDRHLAKACLDRALTLDRFMDSETEQLDFGTYDMLTEHSAACHALSRFLAADNPLLELQLILEEADIALAMTRETINPFNR